MSLFDDDFYSPKVSPRERRRLTSRDHDRWPGRPRLPAFRRPLAVAVAGAAGLVAALVLISPLWGGRGEGTEPPRYTAAPAPQETRLVSVEDIVQRVKPAIVSVLSSQRYSFDGEEEVEQQTGVGSGIVYKREGNAAWVVTNHHVIEGASSLEVVSSDGKRMTGTVVGSDALTDLAVLKIDARELAGVAEFGDSDALAEGEGVVALGHPYGLGFSPTVTSGIISSLHRIIPISLAMDGTIDWEMELLQTDAAINHGNSGGALVNQAGQVIGINSMKVAESGVEGLGFAIPSNSAAPIIAELEQYGKVMRPYLGVATVDLDQYRWTDEDEEAIELPEGVEEGIIVLETYGPASEAGLRTNDVIVELDGRPIDSTLALRKYLYANKKIGDPIRVDYYRDGKKGSVTAQLTETPES